MPVEDSPKLEQFSQGIPEHLPGGPRKMTPVRWVLVGLIVAAVALGAANLIRRGALAGLASSGTVTGWVLDETGQPVQAEAFWVGSTDRAAADAAGRFTLAGVPPGEQVVVVAYRMLGREVPVTVQAGQTHDVGVVRVNSRTRPNQPDRAEWR